MHLEACRHILEHFGYVFTKFAQRTPARWTSVVRWFMRLNLAWEMLRQRTTCRFACSSSQLSCRGCRTCFLCLLLLLRTACFQIFQLQFQLFNLPLDLLRFAGPNCNRCKRAIINRRRSISAPCEEICSCTRPSSSSREEICACCFTTISRNAAASSVFRSGTGATATFKLCHAFVT